MDSKWECKSFLMLDYGWCNDKFWKYKEVDDLKHLCFLAIIASSSNLIFSTCIVFLIKLQKSKPQKGFVLIKKTISPQLYSLFNI